MDWSGSGHPRKKWSTAVPCQRRGHLVTEARAREHTSYMSVSSGCQLELQCLPTGQATLTSAWDPLASCEQPCWLDFLSCLRPNAVLGWNIAARQASLTSLLWEGNSRHCSFMPVCFSCRWFWALENWIKLQSHFLPNTKVQNE